MAFYAEIKKRMGEFLLDVTLSAENDTLAVIGPSGAGKSITLKCIAGIIKPDSGRIVLDGRVLFDSDKKINIPAKDRKIGYLFQNYALFPNMTVEENIAFGMKSNMNRGAALVGGLKQGDASHVKRTNRRGNWLAMNKSERAEHIRKYIERYFLEGCEKLYPHQLSGGQQQRTAIARMLASSPDMILFDEPLSALDTYLRWQMEQEIARTIQEFKGNTLLVTHNMEEVYRLCSNVTLLERGTVSMNGTKEELFQEPKTLSAALLTGCKNISRAVRIDEYTVKALDWGMQIKAAKPVRQDIAYIGFHSSDLAEVLSPEGNNVLRCTERIFMEDRNKVVLLFNNYGYKKHPEWSFIRYEASKEDWVRLKDKQHIYLKIPEESLLQMR